jgi:nicotinamide riboside transporter PnuC
VGRLNGLFTWKRLERGNREMQIGNVVLGTTSVGWLIALLVLIVCIVLLVVGKPLTAFVALILIGALALARLL